jgi:hypothetical protein
VSTETLTAPIETVTPIGPREALRLGRLIYPEKCTLEFTYGERAACAIGAMLAGWGEPVHNGDWSEANRRLGKTLALGVAIAFDDAEGIGKDGDAAALAKLAEYGL